MDTVKRKKEKSSLRGDSEEAKKKAYDGSTNRWPGTPYSSVGGSRKLSNKKKAVLPGQVGGGAKRISLGVITQTS